VQIMVLPRLRYSKSALLVFGAGLVIGLVVVAAEVPVLARVASLAMAAGIVALPFTLIADWRRRIPSPKPAARRQRRKSAGKRKAVPARRGTRRKR
jgi:hypothetical protein